VVSGSEDAGGASPLGPLGVVGVGSGETVSKMSDHGSRSVLL
jgi:hypothetical protein